MQKISDGIFIGDKLLSNFNSLVDLTKYTKVLFVVDCKIPQILVQRLKTSLPIQNSVFFLESGEKHKNLTSVQKIWKALKFSGCDRKSLVINVGGGVTSDIGGFAASTFMRGLDFLQIPTTLLAQVDASVGGKVGINFLGIKNLIGSFQQPIAVIIDVDTLSTLPKREFLSGFAEIIKHGLIADKKYFQLATSKKPQNFSKEELIEIIKGSCRIKAVIVSEDETESNSRKLLNFGHTIGHAVETLSQKTKNPLSHGEAISIGMVAEGKISNIIGLLSDKEYEILKTSIARAGLPITMPKLPADKILEKIASDKKNEKGKTNWTLLKNIGKAVFNQTIETEVIRQVL